MNERLLAILSEKDISRHRGEVFRIVPCLADSIGFPGGPHHDEPIDEHLWLACAHASPKRPLLRFAALMHDCGKPAAWNGENFRHHAEIGADLAESAMRGMDGFDEREIAYVKALVGAHMLHAGEMKATRLGARMRELEGFGASWRDFVRLRLADKHGSKRWLKNPSLDLKGLVSKIKSGMAPRVDSPRLAVGGRDVMDILKLPEGPEVGRALRLVAEKCPNDRVEMLRFLKEMAKGRTAA